jgi:hypothetical protein
MSTLIPRYKTRYKIASLVQKLASDAKFLQLHLQNPAVRTNEIAVGC